MTDSNIQKNRRLMLTTGAAALALGAASSAEAGTKKPGYAVTRTRYGTTAEAYLPTVADAYVLPLSALVFTDNNKDSTLNADNTITINTPGLYRVQLCVDWPGQHGVDHDLRYYGIRRRKAGTAPITTVPGQLTLVPDTDQHLATQDVPGSDPPATVRFPDPTIGSGGTYTPYLWTPGVVPMGGMVSIDLTMTTLGVVSPGDLAFASLTSISDSAIGVAASTALIVTAKVIDTDKIRVSIFNPTIAAGVNVPQGQLRILGMNSILTRGESADAWTVLSTATEQFYKGDTIYALFGSYTPGDYMQTSQQVFVQVERWDQPSST